MEYSEYKKIDIAALLSGILNAAKRTWLAGLIMILICTAVSTANAYRKYTPIYEASASFTVKVINPLYAAANGYNAQTAEQMEKTFPYVLSSNALQERVKTYLDVSRIPPVTAEVISGTNVFTLRVRDTDPQSAYDVLSAVITCYPEVAEFVIGPTSMVLLDDSGVPTQPVNRFSVAVSAGMGAAIGAAVWIAVCGLLAFSRNTVHDEDELQQLLNTPCIGTLPSTKILGKMEKQPMLHQDHGKSGFSEAIRLLGMHAERELREQNKKVLLVSSAVPGEGKTTVSSNLAMALAASGHRVLLVDCDLRSPSVARAFQLENEAGLAEFLEGTISIKNVMKHTFLKNLYVIPGGKEPRSDPEKLLSDKRFSRLVTAAKGIFDCIIFDTSPCGLLADASEAAELAECAVMVVRQDYSQRHQILDGVRYLTDSKIPLIGSVLNGTRGNNANGYGYGYNYGYNNSKSSS